MQSCKILQHLWFNQTHLLHCFLTSEYFTNFGWESFIFSFSNAILKYSRNELLAITKNIIWLAELCRCLCAQPILYPISTLPLSLSLSSRERSKMGWKKIHLTFNRYQCKRRRSVLITWHCTTWLQHLNAWEDTGLPEDNSKKESPFFFSIIEHKILSYSMVWSLKRRLWVWQIHYRCPLDCSDWK